MQGGGDAHYIILCSSQRAAQATGAQVRVRRWDLLRAKGAPRVNMLMSGQGDADHIVLCSGQDAHHIIPCMHPLRSGRETTGAGVRVRRYGLLAQGEQTRVRTRRCSSHHALQQPKDNSGKGGRGACQKMRLARLG